LSCNARLLTFNLTSIVSSKQVEIDQLQIRRFMMNLLKKLLFSSFCFVSRVKLQAANTQSEFRRQKEADFQPP